MKINLLPAEVYNKIAAGEVVDRPYSVVKELVENAIDAGAHQISIEVEAGGKRLVRVTDDGSGISKEDLPYAFSAHATSKLHSADDLFAIRTLGFRGEAIASIAAVSEMKITSKTAGGEAYSLACKGGKLGEVSEDAGALGTMVSVENLFFNTPARLKFLKSDGQEEADVTNMIARFLLSRPEISFTYTANGKVKYRSFGDGLESALAVVYGGGILENCYELDAEKHGIKLHGFIGNQNFSKPNRTYQSLFVNGRFVVNQTVSGAITNAYAAYLMKRQYPFYVLFLDVPSEVVDVNVHPNKADVRFADNQIIYGCVYSIVSAVLDGNSRALEYLASVPKPTASVTPKSTETPVVPKSNIETEPVVLPKPNTETTPIAAPKPLATEAPVRTATPVAAPKVEETPRMSYEKAKEELKFDLSRPSTGPVRFFEPEEEPSRYEVHAPSPADSVFAENKRLLEEREKPVQEKLDPKTLVYKGELFQTYLIYETGDCAYFIDQHAAHERLLYNALREKWEKRAVYSQPMLVPFTLTVNAQEFEFLLKNLPVLREIGFEIEEFGESAFKVSSVPADLAQIDLEKFFAEVLSSMESLRAIKLVDILKDKLATAACKAAIKGGEKLTESEARALIEGADGDMGLRCPHGRPVAVKMKKSEIEKLFKRIV